MKFVLLVNLELLTIENSFLLNKAAHENFSANKYENANNCEHFFIYKQRKFCLLCGDLMTHQPLWVILCCLPEKGRRDIGEIVEEMKERDREESKMNEREETEEIKHSSSTLTC